MKKRLRDLSRRIQWKRVAIYAAIAVPVVMVAVQFIYPFGNTRLYAEVDGVAVGGVSRDEAKKHLQEAYKSTPLDVYFGDNEKPYRSPDLKTLGVNVAADEAVDAVSYPWWLRLVPTSLWWAHLVTGDVSAAATLSEEAVNKYVVSELGEECYVAPTNASLEVKDDALKVVPAKDGGTCELGEVVTAMQQATLAVDEKSSVRLPVERIAPVVDDAAAEALRGTIEERLAGEVTLRFEDQAQVMPAKEVRSWLVFEVIDDQLTTQVDQAKASETITGQWQDKVAIAPGVVTITTNDFIEISRTGGGDGRTLNVDGTVASLARYLTGKAETADVAVTALPPQPKYIRSYSPSDTGLSALMKHYADEHPGIYGVSLIELSGQRRRAGANENVKFTTASTYKTYVAYSVLRRIESGAMRWTDQIDGGRDAAKCFDDMIVLSDNPCPQAFIRKIGYSAIHQDVQALGLGNTSFIDAESFKTTASDLSTFMASLEAGQLPVSGENRSRLIEALKRNVYRRGIPAGATGQVADKVGFLDALLHDTAIVYSPQGTYVLTIMTDGSTWGNIAELTKKIEGLRSQ